MSHDVYEANKASSKFENYDFGSLEFHDSYCFFDDTSYIYLEARMQSYEDDVVSETSHRYHSGKQIRFSYW